MSAELSLALSQFIQMILAAIITAAAPVVVKYIIDWLKAKEAALWDNMNQEQQRFIKNAVEMAVAAAEQSGLANLIKNEGVAKKQYAIAVATSWLERYDIHLDLNQLEALIEAEVRRQAQSAGD